MRDGLTGAAEDGRQPKSGEAGPTPRRRCLGNQDCLQQSRDFSAVSSSRARRGKIEKSSVLLPLLTHRAHLT